ncbi:hypothetical protein B296_00035238 [Ensete ventricosum]|uniref:Uncharacterized protein n=1 Tax=Ensete ventricosum TaxID=4639 RepID=A0A426Y8M4_ENSVE|nr:hypothetical protein B296_00035238 [Ensete ventricosum]
MIEPIEESKPEEEDLEHEENTKEHLQPADCTTHALAGYANPQIMKVKGFALHILSSLLVFMVPLAQRVGHSFEYQLRMPAPLSDSFPYISMFVSPRRSCVDKFFLKCYISPNLPWLLMRHFQILGEFHNFPQDRTMMLNVFLDDDLRSTTQDHEKIESYQ